MLRKDTDFVPEQALFVTLDHKSDVCMENNGKDTKPSLDIFRIMHVLIYI